MSSSSDQCYPRVHIIHVGHMANKGTQALILTDLSIIKEITANSASVSVSTTDVKGVRQLGGAFSSVLPTIIDIPYERADAYAERIGCSRHSLKYKLFALASLLNMFAQMAVSAFSTVFVKVGIRSLYRNEVLGRIKDSDVVVSCSDENFKESASMLPLNVYWVLTWWTLLLSKTWEILVARFLGKKVVMFPNSVGPFRTYIGRLVSKIALEKCDFILVREPISRDIVRDLKIDSNVILTSDTTLLFKSQEKVRTKNVHPIVTVCPGIYSQTLPEKETSRYISAHAKALDLAIDKYGFFVQFLPHYVRGFRYDDLDICRLIHRKMKNADRAKIIEANSVEEFISRIGETDMMISSKMHPSVLATAAFVPSLCVAYDHKQTGFFMSLGLSDCILPIREVTWDKLLSKIEYVWDKKDEIRTMLKTRVPILQEDVKKSIRLVLSHSIRACRS